MKSAGNVDLLRLIRFHHQTYIERNMSAQIEKIALFIDGANLYATAKSLGFDIDYKRLLRAFYYTAVVEDLEYSPIRPLIDWLDYNGYTVVTKATKERKSPSPEKSTIWSIVPAISMASTASSISMLPFTLRRPA